MFTISLYVIPAAAVLMVLSSCASYSMTEFETHMIPGSAVLCVDTFNGDITISWHEDISDMEMEITKTSWRSEGELDKASVTVTANDTVFVKAARLNDSAQVGVSLFIRIPTGMEAGILDTSNGDITVQGGCGDLTADTSNGDITVTGHNGMCNLNSSNGDITFSGETLLIADTSNGDITADIRAINPDGMVLDSSNGSIVLHVFPDINATIEMDTSNGKVSFTDLQPSRLEIHDNSGSAVLGSGSTRIVLDTSNGNIEVSSSETK